MKNLFYLLLSSLLIISCIKDKKTTWETDIMTPIIKSKLTVHDLLKSNNVITNPDSSLKLIYSSDLFSMNTDSFVTLPDSTFEVGSSLQSLDLPNDTFEYKITLGEIMRNSNNALINTTLYNMHGSSWPYPSISLPYNFVLPPFSIVKNDLFDEIKIDEGNAEVIVKNETEFNLNNIDFNLTNSSETGGELILESTFASIEKYSSTSNTFSLDGKTISSQLMGEISNLTALLELEKDFTIIDTTQYILAEIIISDIKPTEATAIWPDQDVINRTKVVHFGSDFDLDFKDASIREGEIYFEIYSSLEDSIYLTYEVSNLTHPLTGLPFKIDTVIPPASPSQKALLSNTYPVNEFHFDFNGYGHVTPGDNPSALDDDTINTYITELSARIQYTGLKKTLSLDDTVYVKAQIKNLRPSFARGYLNNQFINAGPSVINFDLFNKVKSGNIDIEDVNFEIEIDNGIGASAEGRFSRISGLNNNNKVDLTFTPGNNVMQISPASYNGENNRTSHSISSKNINSSNSNIDQFIENFPNTLEYELEVELNYGESKPEINEILDPNNPPNFISSEDEIKASFNMEVPLSIVADSLILIDTLDFNLINKTGSDVKSGKFKLLVDNGFPLDATTSIYFLDDTELIIDSLWTNKTINRAEIGKNGKVNSNTRTVINFEISQEKMDLIKMATKVYVVAGFHTFDLSDPEKSFYKIYSDYSLDLKLVGDFKYHFSN